MNNQTTVTQKIKFAELVLAELETSEEWDADTLDNIAAFAVALDLATNECPPEDFEGFFQRTSDTITE